MDAHLYQHDLRSTVRANISFYESLYGAFYMAFDDRSMNCRDSNFNFMENSFIILFWYSCLIKSVG